MIFWKKIDDTELFYLEDKIRNFANIISFTKLHLFNILKDELPNDYQQENIELNLVMLDEILKNSFDALAKLEWFLNKFKNKKVNIKTYFKDNNLIFLIRDNWIWNTNTNNNDVDLLWWDKKWELFIKNLKRTMKYRRFSIKGWSIILMKIDLNIKEI